MTNLLTPERLVASPSLSGPSPRAAKFSPEGRRLTFLKARADDRLQYDLWAFDTKTGAASLLVDSKLLEPEPIELSEEEKALRERKRIAGLRGIVSYHWDRRGEKILVPVAGDLWLVELREGAPQVRQLTKSEAFEYNAEVSETGRRVSFIRDGALYAIDLESGVETRLSPAADSGRALTYGVAEFVAQEEMDRYVGAWWGPDDRFMAYTRVDESTVSIVPRFDIAADDVTVIEQRYPRAGRPNAIVDLFLRDMQTGKSVQAQLDASPDSYLARVDWVGASVFVQRVNRAQTRIELLQVNPTTGAVRLAYAETQPHWVNLSNDLHPLSTGGFLWSTEESGYRHITLHDATGQKIRSVTSGEWVMREIVGVDEDAELVYFLGFADSALEQHLYRVSYAMAGEPQRITAPGGEWRAKMNTTATAWVGTFSSPTQPPQTGLYAADGRRIAWVEENALDASHPYSPYLKNHVTPEFGTLKADDGQTLHYALVKPHDFDPQRRYPVVVQVYGGPHAQRVQNDWRRLTNIMLAHQGYVVFELDNRGTYNRGKKFEDVIHRQTGDAEVRDQLAGVAYLKTLPFIDPTRIAIDGWSYGGYMALMVTLKAPPGTFAASISGAPVTDWALYDTFYTERYMGTPQNNPQGYKASSVFPYLANLDSPLLLMHGMADDNVTFDNSTRIYAQLQTMKKPFEMMTYPGQRHGVADEDMKVHLMQTKLAFLARHLRP